MRRTPAIFAAGWIVALHLVAWNARAEDLQRFPLRPRLSPLVELTASYLWQNPGVAAAGSGLAALRQPRIGLIAVLDSAEAIGQLRANGIGFRAAVGRVVSLDAGPDELQRLSAIPGVVSVHLAQRFRGLLDVNGQENGATTAHGTASCGVGTLVAVIDSGIDFRHDDFRDDAGRTRIKFLWDQIDTSYVASGGAVGTAPPVQDGSGQPIGTVYTEEQINAALDGTGTVNSVDLVGHGTLAASAAAGNGRATGNGQPAGVYVGGAPKASLLVVRIGGRSKTDFTFDGDVVASLAWIDARADELGMPVVANMSFGSHVGPHDGTTPEEMAIDAFVEKPGRAVAVAAGNDGDIDIHASASTLGSHTLEVFQSGESDLLAVDCWIPAGDIVDLGFADPFGFGIADLNVSEGNCASVARVPNKVAACVGLVDPDNGARELFFSVQPLSNFAPISAGAWRFVVRDEGRVHDGHFDCWASLGQDFLTDADGKSSVSIPGTARGAITVGALTARNHWPSLAGSEGITREVGSLAPDSSLGPTRDGRLKPDLVTGGNVVLGAWSTADGTGSGLAGVPPRNDLVAADGVHLAASGTSFSTPQVCGAAALLLERKPGLTAEEIKIALTQSARTDAFTGSVPNDSWGHGKLDAAAALARVAPIPGDCNEDGVVTIGDLQVALNIFFGDATFTACPSLDVGSHSTLSIDDLQRALERFFGGCLG